MFNIVTRDETWAYYHDPKTKQESAASRTLQLPPWKKIFDYVSVDCAYTVITYHFCVANMIRDISGTLL